jgi:Transposase DDE domain group 1
MMSGSNIHFETLMEAINATRQQVWEKQPPDFLSQAFMDTDGTMAGTLGECKGGMALSYKGIWGYAPLIITLANTREVLYLVNRPGNAVSHEGCVPWIDRAIELVGPRAGEITLRGDTDFTLSGELDRWDGQGIKFIFGMDAHPKVVQLAQALPATAWTPLERLARSLHMNTLLWLECGACSGESMAILGLDGPSESTVQFGDVFGE